MGDPQPQGLTLTAKIAIAAIVLMLGIGLFWHGLSMENWRRFWGDLFDRPGGPMTLRFVLQPTMALIAALKDGIKDARTARAPYLSALLHDPDKRMALLSEGLVATARTVLLGLVIDAIYQLKELGTFYPGEAVNIALILAFVPYLILRGPITRIARHWVGPKTSGSTAS